MCRPRKHTICYVPLPLSFDNNKCVTNKNMLTVCITPVSAISKVHNVLWGWLGEGREATMQTETDNAKCIIHEHWER